MSAWSPFPACPRGVRAPPGWEGWGRARPSPSLLPPPPLRSLTWCMLPHTARAQASMQASSPEVPQTVTHVFGVGS